ncbi:Kinesin heavy chain [Neolecta irregularis DAH-3]|uniref:Kinesin-like protein n=1 Tax=Neolecta irregularis (strain DAH-3) TaxID=1198029 RepID=A0A1U7LSW1_NEOID|nr:Kinesin heavy chain [Neolecta irregularis DAH-3]|eukprot:OLL25760.1 Kinesin heavy chain [Neolecta irregularis DAH-3]
MSASTSIKVICRFRPPNSVEKAQNSHQVVEFEGDDIVKLNSDGVSGSFTFDRVFGTETKQKDIFEYSIRSTVDDIMNGYNGTVFAYGQTGSGKTFTMMGADIDNPELRGVIPRIVEQIFESIENSPSSIIYNIRVSYMEIYMEKIRDLLNPNNDNLPIHEEKNKGVYVKGLSTVFVSSIPEVYEYIKQGSNARAVSATNMNLESSRSHSIFCLSIDQKNADTGSCKTGQLFLVDLAGSEKVGKTGATGQTLEEAKKINKSLSALGMVINALTDGKSSHVPYRDSKLTRILQESLGGNSRTTLIINCSPMSFNDQETLSTLRFGTRAKSIKNKAKVNVELSPAELKALLKKSKLEAITFQEYIFALEGEVVIWRNGEAVPRDKWVSMENRQAVITRPGTPGSRMFDIAREVATPSPTQVRSSTPAFSDKLEKDERDEFLRRENELQDQVAEKESLLAAQEKMVAQMKEELGFLKVHDSKSNKENEKLGTEINELRLQLEKISFESREANITIDGLKEANTELAAELEEIKRALLDAKISQREAILDEKEKKKAEKIAQMMASFDLCGISDKDQQTRLALEKLESLEKDPSKLTTEDLSGLRLNLNGAQVVIQQAEQALKDRTAETECMKQRKQELETRVKAVEADYQALLEQTIAGVTGVAVDSLQSKLEDTYNARQESENDEMVKLKTDLALSYEENKKLRATVEDFHRSSSSLKTRGDHVAQQLADFEVMKKSLMRDLQNRCERVVELEISLDETREQYNNVLRSSNNRAQQKKMAFLERNLEQLTNVQRQLVEQNSSLKKEVAIAERKLLARNERILSLEHLLQDSQDKLTQQSHKFEAQLQTVRERLEQARITRPTSSGLVNQFSLAGARIAKPLRGGGSNANELANGYLINVFQKAFS